MIRAQSHSVLLTAFLTTAGSILGGCGSDFPRDFERLPLERQIKEYELHLKKHGHPLSYAKAAIAEHGFSAADLACARLAKGDQALPAAEALDIVFLVQTGGCSLADTHCEAIVRRFVADHSVDSNDGYFARVTLRAIERDAKIPGSHIKACRATPGGSS